MKYDLQVGLEYLDNNEFEEAYEYFNEMLESNSKNHDARYYRAFIDFFHFRKNFLEDYKDFKLLVDKNTKYKVLSLPLLVILAEEFRHRDEVIKYARLTLKYDNPYMNEIKNILVKELVLTKKYNNVVEALAIIDSILENDEEALLDNYMQKVEVQINFNDFDGAEETLQKAFTKFSANEHLYYSKGRLAYKLYNAKKESVYLEDAIAAFNIALQYEPSFNNARIFLAECYALSNDLEQALTTINDFKKYFEEKLNEDEVIHFEADLVVEKVKICELTKEWDCALEICNEYLEKYEHWKVYYTLGYVQNVISTSIEDLKIACNTLTKSFELNKDTFFLSDLVGINTILKDFKKNDELIRSAIKDEPDNGLLYYLLAENEMRYNHNYDNIISYYKKSFELGYLDLPSYVTHISFLVEKPLELAKKYHKAILNEPVESPWDIRRMGIRYLFGEFGFKQDIKKAYQYLNAAYQQEPTEPCILTIYGRCLELLGKKEEAYEIYTKAFDYYKDSIHITCNCAVGYLAYAKIFGIGTAKNIEEAKRLVLDAINKDHGYSASLVIYLYAYFTLLGEEEFSLNKALEYLSSNYAFDRFDIVRYLFVNKICIKLKQAPRYNEEDIKVCLKNQSKDYKKYYKENKDKDVIFPYYKNF